MAVARRSPSARLYSAVPRESQWPSTPTFVEAQRFSQSASRWSTGGASLRIWLESRSKYASPSGFSALRSESDLRANTSSSVGGRVGVSRGAGGGGGGGGVGVVRGASAAGGGAGGGAGF